MQFRHVAFAVFLLLCAVPAAAQQPSVTLRFQEGLVTLRANNAPVRTILAEWARLGGATILNGDRVAGPTVTLELTDVPERQALDIVLRGVAGYMLAPRRDVSAAASTFDRILILPTSVAPRNPPPRARCFRGLVWSSVSPSCRPTPAATVRGTRTSRPVPTRSQAIRARSPARW